MSLSRSQSGEVSSGVVGVTDSGGGGVEEDYSGVVDGFQMQLERHKTSMTVRERERERLKDVPGTGEGGGRGDEEIGCNEDAVEQWSSLTSCHDTNDCSTYGYIHSSTLSEETFCGVSN